MRDKANPVDDGEFRVTWTNRQKACGLCGIPWEKAPFPGCAAHHLIKAGRSDEACNLLLACGRCHGIIHGDRVRGPNGLYPRISLAVQLRCKRLTSPEEYNRDRLTVLYGRFLPEEEELPEWLADLRRQRGLPC